MTSDRRDELLPLFLDEAGERLERLNELVRRVDDDPEAAVAVRRELHALKGASRMMGLGELSAVCHEAEDAVAAAAGGERRELAEHCAEIGRQLDELGDAAAASGTAPVRPGTRPNGPSDGRHGGRRGEIRVRAAVVDELADRGARLRVIAAAAGGLADRVLRLASLAELGVGEPEPRQVLATLATSLRQTALEIENGQRIFSRLSERQLETLLRLQVQSLAPFMRTLAGHARELADSLGKEVELRVAAGEAELDRRIVNTLSEAFLHLVRNAVDHGIERPAERRAAGKPAAGLIQLRAVTEGDRVRLQVIDDGRGIDPAAVAAATVARGLLGAEDAAELGPSETLQMLMQPGFTTRDETSEVSGRGIGLDAVAAAVRAVGGDVWLESEPGRGTVVTVEVPVARRGERVLVLRAGGHLLALPAAPVQAFRRVHPGVVDEIDGRYVVRLRGRTIEPSFLSGPGGRSGPHGVLLEMMVGGTVVAVVADEVVGEEEVIVRPMPPAAGAPRSVEGIALLASGRPVAVLSPRQLVRGADVDAVVREDGSRTGKPLRVLLVDDSESTREMFRRLLEDGGFAVVSVGTAEEAVRALDGAEFDCIVTDIEMPGMSGLDLTRTLRAEPRFADLPVIVVSTLDRPADRLEGLKAGADAYLSKQGLDARELVALVGRVGGAA
ncbi:MAG TPA: response regulator [Chondromyces sp.]|nr:response regulator [Chondromyces sp.]